jgi:hypothetical protein
MNTVSRSILTMFIGVLLLQGCAETGGSKRPTQLAEGSPQPPPVMASAPATSTPDEAIPEEDGKPVVKADTKDHFTAVVAAIHQQMQPGGRWQYIDKSERNTIDNSFADMSRLYDQFGSVDKMNQSAQVRLLADQSTVNTILTRKDGERLICETNIPVGSHFPVKTCKTYAQMQAEQNGAQEFLRRHSTTSQKVSGH